MNYERNSYWNIAPKTSLKEFIWQKIDSILIILIILDNQHKMMLTYYKNVGKPPPLVVKNKQTKYQIPLNKFLKLFLFYLFFTSK